MALSTDARARLVIALTDSTVGAEVADAIDAGDNTDTAADLTAHEDDAAGAHAASAISVLDEATVYTAEDVEAALAEVKLLADASTSTLATVNSASPSATFNQAVGALTLEVRKFNRMVTLLIPAGVTADGGGAKITSDAALAATYRPTADQVFPVIVTNNAALVLGTVTIKSTGVIEFAGSAAGANFTDDAAAGWPATSVAYVSNG